MKLLSKRVLLSAVLTLLFSGCAASEPSADMHTASREGQTQSPFEITVLDLPVDDETRDFTQTILDAWDGLVLYSVSERYETGHPYAVEQGINEHTDALLVYSLDSEQVVARCPVPADTYCGGGALWEDGCGFDFISISVGSREARGDGLYEYGICRWDGAETRQLVTGCFNPFESFPEIVRLENRCSAFSYSDPMSGLFGVSAIQTNGEVLAVLRNTVGGEKKPLTDCLRSDGRHFLYYYGENSHGIFSVGDAKQEIACFPLKEKERLYSAALLGDRVLLSTITAEQQELANEELPGMLSLRDFEGNDCYRSEQRPFYQLQSDGRGLAIACDSQNELMILEISGDQVRSTSIHALQDDVPWENHRLSPLYCDPSACLVGTWTGLYLMEPAR